MSVIEVLVSLLLCSGMYWVATSVAHHAAHYRSLHPPKRTRQVDDRVEAIGACSRYGECGVLTARGRKLTMFLPVKGEALTFQEEIND